VAFSLRRAGSSGKADTGPTSVPLTDLSAGRFFRLVGGKGRGLAIGRLYDPGGKNELAPLDDSGRPDLGALNIGFRAEGGWQAA
jgi:hypothetical protein